MKRSLQHIAAATTGTSLALALHSSSDQQVSSTGLATSERRAARILFNSCQSCHVGKPLGPPFWREEVCLFDQLAGSVYPDYPYTNVLKESGIIWNETTLDEWLQDPATFIPGNYMNFQGLDNPDERQELIAIMKSFCEETNTTDDPTTAPSASPEDDPSSSVNQIVMNWIAPTLLVGWFLMSTHR